MTTLKRTDRSRMRAMNTKLVFDAVRAVETTSQADLIKATNLSTGTIVSIVRDLRKLGLLVQSGQGASRGGRRPTLLSLNQSAALVLSCRVGSETATVAVLDLGPQVLSRRELPVEPERGPGRFMAALAECFQDQLQALSPESNRVAGLGLSLHGPVDTERGVMLFSEHLGWCDVPFRDELERALGVPVFAEAETRAIALAEKCWGAARDAQDFVLVELDTGIGMVQVLDGKLCRGSHNLAGELGFTVWAGEQAQDGTDTAHVLEDMASLRALSRHARQLPALGENAAVEQADAESAEETCLRRLIKASRSGDTHSRQVLDGALRALGIAIANVINLLDPELVLLTGRLVSGTEGALLEPIRERIQSHLLGTQDRAPRIGCTTLGPDAALLGAARLVIDAFFSVESLTNGGTYA